MKVMWVCNVPIKPICDAFELNYSGGGGWIEGMYQEMVKNTNIDLTICFPSFSGKAMSFSPKKNVRFISFYQEKTIFGLPNLTRVSKTSKADVARIINSFNPDILHIFGTEMPHSYLFARYFNNPNKTIVNIQGLVSFISERFLYGIPRMYRYYFTFSNLATGNLRTQQKKLNKRALFEQKTILFSNNIIGRTDWDRLCVKELNPRAEYYYCGESLREDFYCCDNWDVDKCERHSIFVSQGNYSIKGLIFLLYAVEIVKKTFDDVCVFIGGSSPIKKSILKITPYGMMIKRTIHKRHLENNVMFLGNLSVERMIEQYRKANVFVLPSTVENSPNSLCEAMMIGTPSIASFVGGVPSLMNHSVDGFLYCYDDYHLLAGYILELFNNDNLAMRFSYNCQKRARKNNNSENNFKELINIYDKISKKQ